MVAEIQRLQRKLDQANDGIDTKLAELEEAGFDIFAMSKDLHDGQIERERLKKVSRYVDIGGLRLLIILQDLAQAEKRASDLERTLRNEQTKSRTTDKEQARANEKQSELREQLAKAEAVSQSTHSFENRQAEPLTGNEIPS